MSYVRTAEHRNLRARLIRGWRPLEHSTGPRTPDGKRKSSRNAWKGGNRPALRELAKILKRQERSVEEIEAALQIL